MEATTDLLAKAYSSFAAKCASYWKQKGTDLSAYNTEASARDVQMLANALGIQKFRLFGASYGSHLGIAVIRYHPEIVERAVLGAIEGPDHTIKLPADADAQLAAISKLIASDPIAGQLLPDFQSLVVGTMRQLAKRPVDVDILSGPSAQTTGKLRLSSTDVQLVVASLLGRREEIASIPRIFEPARRGDYTEIAAMARDVRSTEISAMGAAMDCASSSSESRLKTIEKQRSRSILGTMMDFPLPDWCSAWGVRRLPDSFRTGLKSLVPVLFIAGTLDGQTPVSNAVEVRQGFQNGVLFTVQGAGHDASLFRSSPELIQAINRFFETGKAVDSTFQTPPIAFQQARR
jgi:pimeloyl-ACP methyl ester carboxylesterase